MPANTGKAGAIHRVACFAGTPAPTEVPNGLEHNQYPHKRANLPASNRYFDAFESYVELSVKPQSEGYSVLSLT